MTNFSEHLPEPVAMPDPAPPTPQPASPMAPGRADHAPPATARGPAVATVLVALVFLAVAAGALYWQLAGRLPAWEVSGTVVLIVLGSALALIGALASFARSRD